MGILFPGGGEFSHGAIFLGEKFWGVIFTGGSFHRGVFSKGAIFGGAIFLMPVRTLRLKFVKTNEYFSD